MKQIKFIVWVGGVADYEGNNLKKAKAILKEWIAEGYTDAIIEEVTEWNHNFYSILNTNPKGLQ